MLGLAPDLVSLMREDRQGRSEWEWWVGEQQLNG